MKSRFLSAFVGVAAAFLSVSSSFSQDASDATTRHRHPKPDPYAPSLLVDGPRGGVSTTGAPAYQLTTAQLMERDRRATEARHGAPKPIRIRLEHDIEHDKVDNGNALPDKPALGSKVHGLVQDPNAPIASAFTVGTNFTGATLSDTGAFPPDSMGAVGPSQFFVAVNGRLRTFTKAGAADSVINADPDVFFASVMTPVAGSVVLNFTSDPMVRYDRLTGRWFLSIIDVPCTNASCTTTAGNRWMLAVSDNGTISNSTVWSMYYVVTDASNFCDYPTMGIDAQAVYFGCNTFSSAGSYVGTNGFVVQKTSVTAGGPIFSTKFTLQSGSGNGPESPRAVDNFDPSSNEGYFLGPSFLSFNEVDLIRISNPGSASPTASANITFVVPATQLPLLVLHAGNTGGNNGRLDSIDDRFFQAHMRNGRLWTAHHFKVSTTGAATTSTTTGRDGIRWYEFNGIRSADNGGTPVVVQSGTIFDSASTQATSHYYWMPSIMVSGQGHAAMGFSMAGTPYHADAGMTSRLATDTLGTMGAVTDITNTPSAYNPSSDPGGSSGRRWGDYSYTSVDPNDDMTMWTIQEFCDATNSYGVRVAKLIAPPPATPVSAGSSPGYTSGANVTISGSQSNGSGFFDPGAGFTNRLAATVSGGVTVNSVTYTNPTSITLNVDTTAAAPGAKNVTITNPDGQALTGTGILTVAVDSTPNAYAFSAQTGVAHSSPIQSNSITVGGINSAANISISGGDIAGYSIGCTGTFTSSASTISNGQSVCVQQTSSSANSTLTTTTLSIGGVTADFNVTTGIVPPTVVSINRAGTSPTNAGSVDWNVTFSESVGGVDTSDFALAGTGALAVNRPHFATGASITGVTGSGASYTVSASTGFSGTLGLNLADDDSITSSSSSAPLNGNGSGNGDFTGEVYAIDKDGPAVDLEQGGTQADPTTDSPVHFSAVFGESVSDFDGSDVMLGGTAGATLAIVTDLGSGTAFDIAVSGMTANGSVIAGIAADAAHDGVGNGSLASSSTDATVDYEGIPDTTPDPFTFADVPAAAPSHVYMSAARIISGLNTDAPISVSGDASAKFSVDGTSYDASASGVTVHNGSSIALQLTSSATGGSVVSATLTVGTYSTTRTLTTAVDTTPNSFTFSDVTNATSGSVRSTSARTIASVNPGASISLSGDASAMYSVDGTWYDAGTTGTVHNGSQVALRLTAPDAGGGSVSATLTVGTYSVTWSVTTAADTTPAAFNFVDVPKALSGSVRTSASRTVSGLNTDAAISLAGDASAQYSIDGTWYAAGTAGTVHNGSVVALRLTAADAGGATVSSTLTVGTYSTTWNVTTGYDTTPDSITFGDIASSHAGAVRTTRTKVVSGLNTDAAISVSGDASANFSVDGTWYDSTATGITVHNGSVIALRLTTSTTPSTPVSATLTIGTYSTTWTVTSAP